MKKIVCEMCESTEFVKVGGNYKCKSCGMEYSLEDAKRLFVEVDDDKENNSIPEASSNTDVDLEFLKFKSEVIMRCNLYAKSHEINSNLPYKDDHFKDCFLWERSISFNNAKKELLSQVEENQAKVRDNISSEKKEIAENDYEVHQLYKAFTTSKPSISNDEQLVLGIILTLVGIGAFIAGLFMCIGLESVGLGIFCGFIPALIGFAMGVFLLYNAISSYREDSNSYKYAQRILKNSSKYHLVNSMSKISYSYSYVDWYFDEFKNQPNIVAYIETSNQKKEDIENYGLKEKHKIEEYFNELKESTNMASMQMQDVLKKLDQDSVLPEKYRTEQAVCGLLDILINKRASSLKEAINTYEQEQYHQSVLNTLQNINYNLGQIHKEFVEINNTLKVGFSVIGQQNAIIMDELDSIRITNSAIMVDNLLD